MFTVSLHITRSTRDEHLCLGSRGQILMSTIWCWLHAAIHQLLDHSTIPDHYRRYADLSSSQQFFKIRRNSEAELGSSDGTSAPATPRKRGSKAANGDTPAKSTTGKRGNARKGAADDDDEEGSPTKKVKTESRQTATGIKAEHGSEDGVDGKADRYV